MPHERCESTPKERQFTVRRKPDARGSQRSQRNECEAIYQQRVGLRVLLGNLGAPAYGLVNVTPRIPVLAFAGRSE